MHWGAILDNARMQQGAILDNAGMQQGAILDIAGMYQGAILAVQGSLSRGAILGLDNIGWSDVMYFGLIFKA